MMNPSRPGQLQRARHLRGHIALSGILSSLLMQVMACMPAAPGLTAHEAEIADAAQPILTMSPDAVWTDCYNRLLELGPDSIAYLAEQPIFSQPAAPDDLRLMLHSSLIRLLAAPPVRPALTADCLETTLDLLHLDIKSRGHAIGTIWLPDGRIPRAWHELYPVDFDHHYANQVDAEADRQAICQWWHTWSVRGDLPPLARPLHPQPADAFRLFSRRYADLWTYDPTARPVLCSYDPRQATLFRAPTRDYNLVRAACLWSGHSTDLLVRDRLIELVGHPSALVAHNARLALSYSPDPRIREVLDRYNRPDQAPSPSPGTRPDAVEDGTWAMLK